MLCVTYDFSFLLASSSFLPGVFILQAVLMKTPAISSGDDLISDASCRYTFGCNLRNLWVLFMVWLSIPGFIIVYYLESCSEIDQLIFHAYDVTNQNSFQINFACVLFLYVSNFPSLHRKIIHFI